MKKIVFIISILILFSVLLNYPSVFFNKKYSCGVLDIYSSSDAEKVCYSIQSISDKYPFKMESAFKIYLADSVLKYKLFSFFSSKTSFINPIGEFEVIWPADFENKKFIDSDDNFNEEISKALLKIYLFSKFSKLEYIMINDWKITGYSKYVAGEIQEFLPEDICAGKTGKKYEEFENMTVVKYLIEEKKYNTLNLFSDNISYDFYLKQTKSKYCR